MNKSLLLSLLSLAAFYGLVSAEYPTPGSTAWNNDNNVLQYALTLENLEAAFYSQALQIFTAADFATLSVGINNQAVYNLLGLIRDQELSHVAGLTNVLMARGAVPVKPCNYSFSAAFSNAATFLTYASILEKTGVSAYDGAIQSLTQTNLVTVAASIATVEARHSSFLNLLVSAVPFANVTDVTAASQQVLGGVSGTYALLNGTCLDFNNIAGIALFPAVNFRNYSQNATPLNLTAAALNDNNALNYALTLEKLEATFYAVALNNITQASFTAIGVSAAEYSYLTLIRDQEITHVAALSALIASRGATPVGYCYPYKFTFTDTPQQALAFLSNAATLEAAGVGAYLYAASFFTDETLLGLAATVVTVEARHAAFLNELLANLTGAPLVPYPNVTDVPLAPLTIFGAATAFLDPANCPTPIPFPADNFRPNSTTNTGTGSGSGTPVTSSSTSASGSSMSNTVTSSSNSGSNSGTGTGTGSGSGTRTSTSASRTGTTASTSATSSNTVPSHSATANNSDASSLVLSLLFTVCALAALVM